MTLSSSSLNYSTRVKGSAPDRKAKGNLSVTATSLFTPPGDAALRNISILHLHENATEMPEQIEGRTVQQTVLMQHLKVPAAIKLNRMGCGENES